ncbi:hypothetical protein, partial [Streptomyces anthocyanicus]|uniref:hypothetical protein n=1 Tax=Streptomyces anthocyanicus TaxID=68174 RepID=UPI003661F234
VLAAALIVGRALRRAQIVTQRIRAVGKITVPLTPRDKVAMYVGPRAGFWRTLQAWVGWRRTPTNESRSRKV